MSSIVVLPTALKNKIAAGEVVERPASVVRELMENAIDAQSTAISVDVQKGGRKLIRVIDDGVGMDRKDARLCLERHATSKLVSEDALYAITTMGFRGEALPSIASVSRLRLTTAPRGESAGISISMEGGELKEERDAPAHGTEIEVRELFFNTPARKKFLKRDATELSHVVDTVTQLALSHPGIQFRLTVEGQETMNLPRASGLRERIVQVYGAEFMDELAEADLDTEALGLKAFISKPGHFRERRGNQYIFINQRPVRVPSVHHALVSAYEGMLPKDRHPVYFAFLRIEPRLVDVNVHPAKREVRFSDNESVYRFVRRAVADAIMPEVHGAAPPHIGEAHQNPGLTAGAPPSFKTGDGPEPVFSQGNSRSGPSYTVAEAVPMAFRAERPYIFLGETFVALAGEAGSPGLMLLDHHAAHERVLYERLVDGLQLNSHRLLFPKQVTLSPTEHLTVLEHRDLLQEFGIEVEDFGGQTVVVRSLPEALDEADIRGILSDAADELRSGERPGKSIRESVAARIACHGSVRGTKVLSREGLNALLADLENCRDPRHCPHGRPTTIEMSIGDLKKLFKRK